LGIPTLVVGWGHKYAEVLAQFDLEEWAYDYSSLELESLCQAVERLISRTESVREKLVRHRARVMSSSLEQLEWVSAFLTPALSELTDEFAENEAP
jgi:polysaccharide pyruvyl transferase WcaK-like protein